jgi:hypothetical protein
LFRQQLRATCAREDSAMNGWDLFTWFDCVVLSTAAITIFSFFLKDAKGILTGERSDAESG